MGQSVHKGIGRRIIALSRGAQYRSRRGEENKEVEGSVQSEHMKIPGTIDLGPHNTLEALPIKLYEDAIIKRASCMDDAP